MALQQAGLGGIQANTTLDVVPEHARACHTQRNSHHTSSNAHAGAQTRWKDGAVIQAANKKGAESTRLSAPLGFAMRARA